MVQTGQLLKHRRESLNISVAEVSIATKITPRMVKAIEAGDMERLPARTFLRGFVKSYAAFLKMDVGAVLKSFADEMAALEPAPPNLEDEFALKTTGTTAAKASGADTRTSAELISDGLSVTKKTSLALGLLALIGLTVFIYRLVEKYEREAQVQELPTALTPVTPGAPEEESEEAEAKAPEEKVDEKSPKDEPAEEKAVVTEAKKESEKPVPADEPVKTPATPAITPAEKPPVAAAPASAKPPAAPPAPAAGQTPPAQTAAPAAARGANQELIIEALDRVDLSFRINGGELKKVTLQPDQYHTIKATGSISLDVSDGGAVNVIHNGRDLGVPGDLGRPKKLQLP